MRRVPGCLPEIQGAGVGRGRSGAGTDLSVAGSLEFTLTCRVYIKENSRVGAIGKYQAICRRKCKTGGKRQERKRKETTKEKFTLKGRCKNKG